MPGMSKLCVASSATVFEPRTAATTTTASTGFRDGATSRTHGTDCRRRDCWCVYVGIGQNAKENENKSLHVRGVSLGLTLAGPDALKPIVISVPVPGTSAILIPSTARSATTGSV